MCYNGKCMHCIEIETGSLIFGIFSVTLIGLGILFIIGALVYVNVLIATAPHVDGSPEHMQLFVAGFTVNIALGVALCLLLVPFAFTVVLIKGLVQKKAGLVKVYFVYSVVSKGLALVGAVMGLLSGRYPGEHVLSILLVAFIYALILRMIYLTYTKLEVEAQFKERRLVEQKY